jgi:hypothetical protein
MRNKSPVAATFVNESGRNVQSLQRTFHRCFLPSFGLFRQAVSENIFKNQQYLYRDNCILNRYLYLNKSYLSFSREDFFRNQPIRNKNGLWRSCLLTDRDEMSILYRGPAIDASYQVSIHSAQQFQRRLKKISQSETRIAYGSHVC